jgi:hypothetical protein
MGMSNATANQTLKMHLQGNDPGYRAGATQYIAMLALPLAEIDRANPLASELSYTGYIRPARTKATAWTDNGTNFTNASTVTGGKRTDAGAVQTWTSFAVVDTSSGAVSQCILGELDDPLDITKNVLPTAEPGALTVTAQV